LPFLHDDGDDDRFLMPLDRERLPLETLDFVIDLIVNALLMLLPAAAPDGRR
jgi:hypothetical protein